MIAKIRGLHAILAKPAEDRSLDEKLFISSGLTGLEYSVNILCRIVSTLVLTRLLSPEIFGLFAIIITFQVIVVMLTDFGVRSLIIISDDASDPEFLKTCWTVQALRGFALYMVILVIALTLGILQDIGLTGAESVYTAPELAPALAVAGFQLVLQGFESVNQHVHAREMQFGRICMINVIRSVISPMLTIAIAWHWPSVWSLVVSGLCASVLHLILTFRLFPGVTMNICLHKGHAQELFDRGKWIMSHSTLTVITTTADKILLSVFLPSATLGIYSLAFQMIDIPRQLLFKIENSLFLQTFRSLAESDKAQDIQRQYYRYRIPYDALACITAGGFLTASPALIELMYDPRYADAGEIMQVLALGLPFLGMSVIREAFSAQKRFREMTLMSLIQAGTIWIGLLVALPVMGSMLGAFLVIAFHRVPELVVLLGFARREGWIVLWKEFRIWPVILVGAALGLGVEYVWSLVKS